MERRPRAQARRWSSNPPNASPNSEYPYVKAYSKFQRREIAGGRVPSGGVNSSPLVPLLIPFRLLPPTVRAPLRVVTLVASLYQGYNHTHLREGLVAGHGITTSRRSP